MSVYLDVLARLDEKSADTAAADAKKFFSEHGRQAGTEFSQQLSTAVAKGDRDVEKALSGYQRSYRSLQDMMGNVRSEQVKLNDVIERFGATSSQATSEAERLQSMHRKLADATAAASAQHSKLADAVRDSTGGMSNQLFTLQNLTSQLESHSETAGSAMSNLGSAGSLMGLDISTGAIAAVGGIAAIGGAVYEATSKLYEMGKSWADMEDKITFTTGKTGDEVKAMTDRVSELSTHVAAPAEAIGTVYTQLTRLKDLQGATLDDLTKHISAYNQMAKETGGDPLNVALFTRVMQQFHVPAADMRNDLNALVQVSDEGQVPINDLIESFHSAGSAASIAGLSFGETANLMATLHDAGVDTDKAMTGFRLALGNLAKDAPELKKQITFAPDESETQRLADVITKIQTLHDESVKTGDASKDIAAIDLGKSVFGKSWADIDKAILDGKLNVDSLHGSIDSAGDAIRTQYQATDHWSRSWQQLKNDVEAALKPLSEHVFDGLDMGLHEIDDTFSTYVNTWRNEWHAIFGGGNTPAPSLPTPGASAPNPTPVTTPGGSALPPGVTGGRAGGGPLNAPGPKGKDSALFWGAAGEHVLTAGDVDAMGGHSAVHAFRAALHRESGGPLGQDVQVAHMLEGTPYSQAARTDCSGMVARIISQSLGVGGGSLPSTKNMGQWLQALGFQTGIGGTGSISVGWYDKGGGPNSGHAAMTLSDGENAESGPAGKLVVGAGAAGAASSEFDHHMFLPQAWAEGAGGGGGGGFGGGGSFSFTAPDGAYGGGLPPGATAGTGPNGMPGYYTSDQKKVDAAQERIAKLQDEVKILEEKKSEETVKTKQAEKDKIDQDIKGKQAELAKANAELDAAQKGDFHEAHWNAARTVSGTRSGGGMSSSRGGKGDWGASIDADFGVGKGVGGIAKNLTAFLGDLAFAPVFGALNAVGDTYGTSGPGGTSGLLGLALAGGGGGGGGGLGGLLGGGGKGRGKGGQGGILTSLLGTPGATGSPVDGSTGPLLTPDGLPKQMTGQGQGFGLSGGGILGAATSGAIGAGSMALNGLAPGAGQAAGIAAQIGTQELSEGITYASQVAGIAASGLLQTFMPDAPTTGWGAKLLGGVMGAHPVTTNSADQGQQGQKGSQQGDDGRPDPGKDQGDTTGTSAPPLKPDDNPQQPGATTSGDTVHGPQFKGPTTVNNGPTVDQTMQAGMQLSAQQVGTGGGLP